MQTRVLSTVASKLTKAKPSKWVVGAVVISAFAVQAASEVKN
jgi:hypothetical protein